MRIRRRSLNKDMMDNEALMNSRDKHLGVSISNEFYQPVPMFFTREGAQMNLIGHYRGRSAFLICNGPSFVKLNRSLLDKPGVMTFGINNGPKTFRPNFWTCVDDPHRFLKSIWLDPQITKFIPQQHFERHIFDNDKWEMMKVKVGDCPNVIGYRRNEKFVADRFLFEDTFNWGCHKDYGGGRSVMLPSLRILFLLGFRKVYLLGCDMKMAQNYTYHFDEQRSKGAVNCNNNTYDRLKSEYLPALKPIFEAEGFNVFNCNQDSELKVFPFKSFEEAIKEATEALGDVPNERCWGMYANPKEKPRWKQEPPKETKIHLDTLKAIADGKPVPPPIKLPRDLQINLDRLSDDPEDGVIPFPPQTQAQAQVITQPQTQAVSLPPPPPPVAPPIPKNIVVPTYRTVTTPDPKSLITESRGTGQVKTANPIAQTVIKSIVNNPTETSSVTVKAPEAKPPVVKPPELQPVAQPMAPRNRVPLISLIDTHPVKWNTFNKVVLDHRNGCIDIPATNTERAKRGLPTPWTPEIGEKEVKEPPIP